MLTDREIKALQPSDRLRKVSDGAGLQLWITPDGAKRWRFAYRFGGSQKLLALGVYPTVGLKAARDARDDARQLLQAGQDPSVEKKLAKVAKAAASASTLGIIADELIAKKKREGKAERTLVKIKWFVDLVRPALGARPIAEITSPEVLAVLRGIEARGRHETAKRVRSTLSECFRFAIATGRAENDPTMALRGALISAPVRHQAAITDPAGFGGLLRAIRGYGGAPETRSALELLALTFTRPGELRAATWGEFNLDGAVWSVAPERMKMRRPHHVPLAPQALAIVRELQEVTGPERFLFPAQGARGRCLSENTLNGALRRLGFTKDEATSHGFRAAAASILNECGLWNPDAIEAQLAHQDRNAVRRAYQRADFWDERVRMMTWWADRCDEMRGAK